VEVIRRALGGGVIGIMAVGPWLMLWSDRGWAYVAAVLSVALGYALVLMLGLWLYYGGR
jgi:hypothetical protein